MAAQESPGREDRGNPAYGDAADTSLNHQPVSCIKQHNRSVPISVTGLIEVTTNGGNWIGWAEAYEATGRAVPGRPAVLLVHGILDYIEAAAVNELAAKLWDAETVSILASGLAMVTLPHDLGRAIGRERDWRAGVGQRPDRLWWK